MRLRKRWEFRRLDRRAKRLVGKNVVIDILENRHSRMRLGITVTRRYGKAIARNRFKRLVRESFRLVYSELEGSADINVRPRRLAQYATLEQIQQEIVTLLQSA